MGDNFDAELLYIEMLENLGPERVIAERNDHFYLMDDTKFVMRYRLSKQVTLKLLQQIEGMLEYPTNRNIPLTPIQQLLLTLRFYATGSFQIVIGDTNGVSKATISRYIKIVSEAIASLRHHYICFPSGDEARAVIQEFYRICNFPGVIGAIDCTHIPIQSPGGQNAEVFRNRKQYFSINVQTISDANLLIRNVIARWPGSVHDSFIFDNTQIRMMFETGRIPEGHLLGDNGYRLAPYLLTPFLNPRNERQENYNRAHVETRNTVERQYGVWKRRFPALSLGLRTKVRTSLIIIVATAILHNIAIQTREEEPPEDQELLEYLQEKRTQDRNFLMFDDVPVPNIDVPRDGAPAAVRQRIVDTHFL